MQKSSMVFLLLFFCHHVSAQSQLPATSSPSLTGPGLNLHITRAGEVVGQDLSINELREDSENFITGKITLFGQGDDGCRLQNATIEGSYDNGVLVLQVRTPDNDNLSCLIEFSLIRQASGKLGGRFINAETYFAGTVVEK